MKILILGIGNILFGDEGIGPHMVHYLEKKYRFESNEHSVDLVDGGTLAQRLIPIITDYDHVLIIDCVTTDDGEVGDVYFFDFNDAPACVTWQGSAHEVEMLQTLQMIQMFGDLPPVKIVGVVPYVIGEDSTFSLTDEVLIASKTMEKAIIDHLAGLGVEAKQICSPSLQEVAKETFIREVR
ncbi:MAG: hydrogenase expression/formation protein [Hydrogenimonas sp.]|jgi:hydrogenase maturation protease|nr:MAG: hydrogenase expression/formation protein [Hydrogenimonas sp.]